MTNNASRHVSEGRAKRIAGRTALGVLAAPMAMLAVAGPAGAATLDLGGTLADDALDVNLAADEVALPGVDSVVSALPTELPDNLPIDGVAFDGVKLDLFDLGGADDLTAALPELPALPGTDALPASDVLGALPVSLPDLALDAPALPAVGDLALPALPSTDDLPALPGVDSLSSLPVDLPSLPAVGDLALPELPALPSTDDLPALPSTDDLPSLPGADSLPSLPVDLPSLPSTDDLPALPALPDAAGAVTDLAGNLPAAAAVDLDSAASTVTDAVPAAGDVFSATDLVQGLI